MGRDIDRAKAHIVRTNMVLPEGASVIGLVASPSLTFSFRGSLSPGLTWVGARRAATWAWAVCAARFTMLATGADIFGVVWNVGSSLSQMSDSIYIYPINTNSHVEV
jgi:predicted benzoate:H+ symporter BenE